MGQPGYIDRPQDAIDVDIDNTSNLYRPAIVTVQEALDNLRIQRRYELDSRDTNLEPSHTLTATDNTFHSCIGTGSGYFFVLPDATTCLIGQEFEIYNGSTNQIEVRDDGGTVIVNLNSTDLVRLILDDNTTTNGVWLLQTSSTTATGIQSYVVTSDILFTTSSSTDVVITGFTITPVSGRYAVWYSADIVITNNNRSAQNVIYVDGSAVENTRRLTQGIGANFEAAQNSVGEITVNGAQAVDVRVNVSAGSLDVNQRSLVLIRLGGA